LGQQHITVSNAPLHLAAFVGHFSEEPLMLNLIIRSRLQFVLADCYYIRNWGEGIALACGITPLASNSSAAVFLVLGRSEIHRLADSAPLL